jgi:hypothetical protein
VSVHYVVYGVGSSDTRIYTVYVYLVSIITLFKVVLLFFVVVVVCC